ncbi:MAG: hypothetical protein IPJ61_19950 [Tessaracoccus sp.]|uniref:hypothetical protein n=1 Tax=Tessaracoccus sp. TaxID=1971211 RepID=UPI001ED20354|nr:hypothetical protein [Tessaracoccus sp.]MBK7823260.1 hypothetical protein [Tessaracoccus sp.]
MASDTREVDAERIALVWAVLTHYAGRGGDTAHGARVRAQAAARVLWIVSTGGDTEAEMIDAAERVTLDGGARFDAIKGCEAWEAALDSTIERLSVAALFRPWLSLAVDARRLAWGAWQTLIDRSAE